jgi:hypothetical protein
LRLPPGALCTNYQPPGPVAAAFIADVEHELVGIMGPFGSGKTSACPIKAMHITRLQPRSKHDQVIRSKGYVIRDTYRNLEDKTLPSWLAVFPDCHDWPLTGPKGGPRTQVIKWDEPRPWGLQRFEMIVEFRAIGDDNYEDFAKGLLATWIWLNEADTINEGAVDPLLGRLGRFPLPHDVADDATPGFGCVMCDFNAPLSTNWTWRRLVLRRMLSGGESQAFCYVQPSGLDPAAENPTLRKLKPDYYVKLAANMEEWERKRFIENKPGYARTGHPIYTEFDTDRHVLKANRPADRRSVILWGVDGGLNFAAVPGQRLWTGQLHVMPSLVTPDGAVTDASAAGARVRGEMSGRYAGCAGVAMLDPSTFARNANVPDQTPWAYLFQEAAGIPCVPAPTNAIERRHRAVRHFLNGSHGGESLMLIDPDGNDTLLEGYIAGYRVRKFKSGEDVRYADQPDKNRFSHVHDAKQYLCQLAGGDPSTVELAIQYQAELLQTQRDARLGAIGGGGPAVIHD